MNNLYLLDNLMEYNFKSISFKRGLGIIEPMFIVNFENEKCNINIEVQANFRIRDSEKVFLNFNDLYIDLQRRNLSVKRFRSQKSIEKSFLNIELKEINNLLFEKKLESYDFKKYGDLNLTFENEIIMEIFNDSYLENAVLFRIISNINGKKIKNIYKMSNGKVILC